MNKNESTNNNDRKGMRNESQQHSKQKQSQQYYNKSRRTQHVNDLNLNINVTNKLIIYQLTTVARN